MAINYELLNKGIIPLGGNNFQLLGEVPLDSRLVVPTLDGLQNLIDNAAAYEGMIAYVTSEKKHYEVKVIDGVLSYRQFGLTNDELNELITNATTAAMEFKGVTATLPENPAKGDMYKVSGETINITIEGVAAKTGDSIVYNGEEWFLIPSGDDIEDTWRPVAGVANDATLTFEAGDKLDVAVASTGTVKYSHEAIAAPELLAENEQTRTYITAVETDGFGHITGYKTATENVEDTNTTYEFECAAEHSDVYFTVKEKLNGEDVAEHTVCVDAYNKNQTDTKIREAVEALDVNDITGFGAGKTLATLTETDGKIAATFQDIAITESQITDLGDYKTKQTAYSAEGDVKKTVTKVEQNENGEVTVTYGDIDFSHNHDDAYKKLQTAIAAVETSTNTFVDTVAQNANGEITITTKSVDFTGYNTDAQNELKYKQLQEAIEAVTTDKNVFVETVSQDANGVITLGTKSVDFTDVNNAIDAITRAETGAIAVAKAEAIEAAQNYANGLDHEDTTYTLAATENALEFTVTPDGKGAAQTVKLVAPTVDTGVMSVEAGNDIVVTPGENGKVTIAHETFTTGEYTRDPATSDKTGDQYFFTGVTVDNGHVTGANVKSLAAVLEAMSFIIDGGTSAN